MANHEKLFGRRNALIARVKGEFSVAKDLSEANSQSEVRERLDQLKLLADNFRATQEEIEENQTDPAAVASVFDVREEFFGVYYRVKNIYERLQANGRMPITRISRMQCSF